jgi:glycosyltransferase involved in cell wall biosynthesis
VGRVCPPKNQFESVRVVEKLRKNIPNIKLLLAGATVAPYEKMLRKYISAKGLEKNVIFTDYLPHEIIRNLYHACDVVLSPTKEQGGWLAPFEAICASKTVVVSPNLSSASIIKKEKIGIVTHDFAKAIWDIYKNPNPYRDMTLRGKRWIAENLTWNRFCEKMIAAFQNALDTA